jgi:hypothetical protein
MLGKIELSTTRLVYRIPQSSDQFLLLTGGFAPKEPIPFRVRGKTFGLSRWWRAWQVVGIQLRADSSRRLPD